MNTPLFKVIDDFFTIDDFCLLIEQPMGQLLLQKPGYCIQLIMAVRRNRKDKTLSNAEKLLLRKRLVIETVNDELKNICQAEHTPHRSLNGFLLNLMSTTAAYSFFPKKPSIRKDI